MNKITKYVPFIIIILVIFLLISVELKIQGDKQTIPETILIKVLKSDGKTPEQNASCKADIITEEKTIEDKSLNKIENMFEYIDVKKWDIPENKGYYELKTGLDNYIGNFEIKIVCVSQGNLGVSYTILNNTNIPCEVKEKGFIVC